MCGIVHKPTHQKNFATSIAGSKFPDIARKIVELCEETHIPAKATELVLKLVELHLAGKSAFAIPFTVYQDGKRFVSDFSMGYEEAVLHLAMAGSTLFYINRELKPLGKEIVMGHCCEIRLHATNQSEEAMRLAHDDNVYRADKLRENPSTFSCSREDFLNLLPQPQKNFWLKVSACVPSELKSA